MDQNVRWYGRRRVSDGNGQWLLPYERIDERADRGMNRPDWY